MITTLLSIDIGIDPTIFDQWGVEVTWHGLFTAVGVVMGVAVATWFARKAGYKEDQIYNVALALVIGGIIGARGLYVIEHWTDFKDHLGKIIEVNEGGISIYGALIGGTIGAWAYGMLSKVRNIPQAADIAAIGAILGMAVGRIGDIINGVSIRRDVLRLGVPLRCSEDVRQLPQAGRDDLGHRPARCPGHRHRRHGHRPARDAVSLAVPAEGERGGREQGGAEAGAARRGAADRRRTRHMTEDASTAIRFLPAAVVSCREVSS